jgi:hypothetical protein
MSRRTRIRNKNVGMRSKNLYSRAVKKLDGGSDAE